jgi:hypothetical protein
MAKQDERMVVRDNDPVMRGNPHQAADTDRELEDGLMSRAERMQMLKNEWQQVALPAPPRNPDWHYFWASTTNSTDTVHRRTKLGYVLVKRSEIPDFKVEKMQSGEYAEYFTCNEMVLMKIPMDIYHDILTVFHHDAPLEEERSIREQVESRRQELNSKAGRDVIQSAGDGLEQLGSVRRAPKFLRE